MANNIPEFSDTEQFRNGYFAGFKSPVPISFNYFTCSEYKKGFRRGYYDKQLQK